MPKTKRLYRLNISKLTKPPKIAYFIFVHRFPKQFKKLFKGLYDPENDYLIHIDLKAEDQVKKNIKQFLKEYSNASLLQSENIEWGDNSMVKAELNGMKYLLSKSSQWDFFINLSDQDFPLKPQGTIRQFLRKNKDKNFIKTACQSTQRPDALKHIENYFQGTDHGFSGEACKRILETGVTSYNEGQWIILTRSCCEFICHSPEVKKIEDIYCNTSINNKSFFQTVLMNTSFDEPIINDDKRAVIWIPDGDIMKPKTLTKEDIDFLMDGKNLFARKFDEKIDNAILDILEEALTLGFRTSSTNTIVFDPVPIHVSHIKKSVFSNPKIAINHPLIDN